MKKIKRKLPKLNKVLYTCCWCGSKIERDQEVFGIGARKRPGIDISKYERGGVMPMTLSTIERTIYCIVSTPDSDARKQNKDFMFTLCSEKCGVQLKEVLDYEKDLGNMLFNTQFSGKMN